MTRTAIWWIRRDLRLADNQALTAAAQGADQLVPLYVLDPVLLNSSYSGEKRLAFLYLGLKRLDESLRRHGGRLIVRRGDVTTVLNEVVDETQADSVVAERDHSPYARHRDRKVGESLSILELTEGIAGRPVGSILKENGDPYTVYTPFSRAWKERGPITERQLLEIPEIPPVPPGIGTLELPTTPAFKGSVPFAPGEHAARQRLRDFAAGDYPPVYQYADLRNRPDVDGTSQLSPYIRFGMLSARQAATAAYAAIDLATTKSAVKGAETWLNEIIWRDFYISILYHFPHVRQSSFRPEYNNILWRNDAQEFQLWCRGQTGYPFVDAAMRQLNATGWMHNRARMVVASFLVKDLLIDWRWGERYFMQHLVDGDPANNNGGWQWTAGTGTDAAPYFRIFNPVSQSEKHDTDGEFIRTWVPELINVPSQFIHVPWQMPEQLQLEIGCLIGHHYPVPIVDHQLARKRTLEAYKSAKN